MVQDMVPLQTYGTDSLTDKKTILYCTPVFIFPNEFVQIFDFLLIFAIL